MITTGSGFDIRLLLLLVLDPVLCNSGVVMPYKHRTAVSSLQIYASGLVLANGYVMNNGPSREAQESAHEGCIGKCCCTNHGAQPDKVLPLASIKQTIHGL